MRVLIAAEGYPPERQGDAGLAVQALARAAARTGHAVLVVAGSAAPADAPPEALRIPAARAGRVAVRRLRRADLYSDHWQKGASVAVSRAFARVCRKWRPDVVHVAHWRRLSDDLVLAAARAGVPAVVSLADHLASCLLASRVHPVERAACTRPYTAGECVRCAGVVPPRTPWMPREELWVAFAERAAALGRELRLARARLVPSLAHGEALLRQLGESLALQVAPPLRPGRPAPRAPRAAPGPGERLVLGAWERGGSAPLGLELLVRAASAAGLAERIELRIAGAAGGLRVPGGIVLSLHPAPRPRDLAEHPVTDAHAMVATTVAPEPYGIVADEALELGLPMVLPRTAAFAERFRPGRGVLFYAPADATDLARSMHRLASEPELLARLRARLPDPAGLPSDEDVAAFHLELWERVARAGAPLPDALPAEEWFAVRMRATAQAAWDAACERSSAAELGFGGDPPRERRP